MDKFLCATHFACPTYKPSQFLALATSTSQLGIAMSHKENKEVIETKNDDDTKSLNSFYKREVSLYLLNTKNRQHLSRYFALSALDDTYNSKESADNDEDVAVGNDYICPCCGNLHKPGLTYNNKPTTTIRVRKLKRGRTRRRKASRIKRKQLEQKELNSVNNKSTNKKWQVDDSVQSDQLRKDTYYIKQVNDGMAKNCVVYKCGFCFYSMKYKGNNASYSSPYKDKKTGVNLKSNVVSDVTNNNTILISTNNSDTESRKKNPNKPTTGPPITIKKKGCVFKPNGQFVQASSTTKNNDDYIPLTSQRSRIKTTINKRKQTAPPFLLSKKKKKEDTKKSQLMDFLSSLND